MQDYNAVPPQLTHGLHEASPLPETLLPQLPAPLGPALLRLLSCLSPLIFSKVHLSKRVPNPNVTCSLTAEDTLCHSGGERQSARLLCVTSAYSLSKWQLSEIVFQKEKQQFTTTFTYTEVAWYHTRNWCHFRNSHNSWDLRIMATPKMAHFQDGTKPVLYRKAAWCISYFSLGKAIFERGKCMVACGTQQDGKQAHGKQWGGWEEDRRVGATAASLMLIVWVPEL